MAEELQHLIDRIQKEALDQAEAKAADILAKAKAKAAALVSDAEGHAADILAKAEKDAQVFAERAEKTLEQSARDLLITVGQGVGNILDDIVAGSVAQALDASTVCEMLAHMAEQCVHLPHETRLEILVSPEDQQQIVQYFAEQYRKKLVQGVEIHTDNEVLKGFKVSMRQNQVYLDFTDEAIAEAICEFLRPRLAKIVRRAADMEKTRPAGAAPAPSQ